LSRCQRRLLFLSTRRHFRQLLEQTQRFVQPEYALAQDTEPRFASPAHAAAARTGLGVARSSTWKAGHASMLFPGWERSQEPCFAGAFSWTARLAAAGALRNALALDNNGQ
jgi:hypothetical protein